MIGLAVTKVAAKRATAEILKWIFADLEQTSQQIQEVEVGSIGKMR
jgi:hypothetical protein